jgi:hypothetical protein
MKDRLNRRYARSESLLLLVGCLVWALRPAMTAMADRWTRYQAEGKTDEARRAFQQAKDLGWTLAASDSLGRPFLVELERALTR